MPDSGRRARAVGSIVSVVLVVLAGCTGTDDASPSADATRPSDGSSEPVAMRVITFGTGGLMSTLTVIGATPADVDAVDVSNVLGEAASSFTALFSGGS